jgi:hypothetical protein
VGTPSPRGTESTLPGRVSTVRNVETPSGSGPRPGKPTVREAQSPGGTGWSKKRMPVAERRQESEAAGPLPSAVVSYNWPDTGRCLARRGADVDQVSL